MNFSWIDEIVDGVIEYCDSRDIFEIYDILDVAIKKAGKGDHLLQGNDALYIRNYTDIEIVFIRDDFPLQYEKFVLAHELGHALLHVDIVRAAFNNKLILKGKLERQADYFALKLLNISIDEVCYEGLTKEQIAKDLCIRESCLEYC